MDGTLGSNLVRYILLLKNLNSCDEIVYFIYTMSPGVGSWCGPERRPCGFPPWPCCLEREVVRLKESTRCTKRETYSGGGLFWLFWFQVPSISQVDTILTLDANKGKVVSSFGKDMFYMPHGLVSILVLLFGAICFDSPFLITGAFKFLIITLPCLEHW